MSRQDIFRNSAKKRKAEREEQESGGGNFENIDCVPLVEGRDVVLRCLGLPHDHREGPTDIKQVDMAIVKDDQGNFTRIIYGLDQDFILRQVLKTAMKGQWNQVTETKTYDFAAEPFFAKIMKNASQQRFAKGWRPQTVYMINAISRAHMDWHRENRHTLLIAKKKNVKEDKTYYTYGVSGQAYDQLLEIAGEKNFGDWSEYDVVMRKVDGQNRSDNQWYLTFHGATAAQEGLISPEAASLVNINPLSDEERSWEMYDLDKLFPVTRYRKILSRLGQTIKQVDEAAGTRYYEQLEDLAARENADKDAENRQAQATNHYVGGNPAAQPEAPAQSAPQAPAAPQSAPQPETPAAPAPPAQPQAVVATTFTPDAPATEAPTRRATRRSAAPAPSGIDWGGLEAQGYKGVPYLTQEERDMIIGVNADGSFQYVDGADLVACDTCGFVSPLDFHICPKCGLEFAEDETV